MDKYTHTDALVIFARQPVPGLVKTRLAKTVGPDAACRVYQRLLQKAFAASRQVDAARFVYLPEGDQLELPSGFEAGVQVGHDLGSRMQAAFSECFSKGFRRVVLIGSDCPNLTPRLIRIAFDSLQRTECVFGPAKDGGYYLVGQKPPGRDLFRGILWSSPDVWSRTQKLLHRHDWSYSTLSMLEDIDDLDSLMRYQSETGETLTAGAV